MKIISKKLLKILKKNIKHIHPSLLPKYKGLNTFERMLKNNEKSWMHSSLCKRKIR